MYKQLCVLYNTIKTGGLGLGKVNEPTAAGEGHAQKNLFGWILWRLQQVEAVVGGGCILGISMQLSCRLNTRC